MRAYVVVTLGSSRVSVLESRLYKSVSVWDSSRYIILSFICKLCDWIWMWVCIVCFNILFMSLQLWMIGAIWCGLGFVLKFGEMLITAKNTYRSLHFVEKVLYVTWNIWEKRNGLIFYNIAPSLFSWRVLFKNGLSLLLHRLNLFNHWINLL